jgi:hypothetical protein
MATANLNDMATIATDAVFGNRVFMSLIEFCTITIPNETITTGSVQLHMSRKNYAAQILNNPTVFKPLFVNAVAANQIVANDATASGTVVGMSPTSLATATLLCTDTDINNAVAAAFNAFVSNIG